MTTAGNLSIEICYQKLKVNSNYCFWHSNFQNQVYTFFCIISWVVLYSSVIARFAGFLLRISCHSNVSEKFDFCFTEFRKATACLCMTHTAPTLTLTLSCGNILGKKILAKEKYKTQLNSVLLININKDLATVLHPPKIYMKCCLMNTASKRNI